MISDRIREYTALINAFVAGSIVAADFEQRFLQTFKSETVMLHEPAFSILDGLFANVDSYCDDPALREPSDLSEEQLRERAAEALRRLNDLLK
jgi:Bacterial self-protective colicin-like immunity